MVAALRSKPDENRALRPTQLTMYQIEPDALRVIPGRSDRDWMSQTNERFAYRCLPLTIANASGWEFLSPCSFEATWTGGDDKSAITLRPLDGYTQLDRHATSHFGHGTLTLHTGYLLRTDPGWATWVRGAPNFVADGIQPLDGLVETDWLPFSFTMNWIFTRPGSVVFNEGDALAFVTPIPHLTLDEIAPQIVPLASNPALFKEYSEWATRRLNFNKGLAERDPEIVKQGWQRNYTQGKNLDGDRVATSHVTKRKLKTPALSMKPQSS